MTKKRKKKRKNRPRPSSALHLSVPLRTEMCFGPQGALLLFILARYSSYGPIHTRNLFLFFLFYYHGKVVAFEFILFPRTASLRLWAAAHIWPLAPPDSVGEQRPALQFNELWIRVPGAGLVQEPVEGLCERQGPKTDTGAC